MNAYYLNPSGYSTSILAWVFVGYIVGFLIFETK